MAGHSKWKQIKHKKAATDGKRSQVFGKLARLIAIESKKVGGRRIPLLYEVPLNGLARKTPQVKSSSVQYRKEGLTKVRHSRQ